MPIGASGKTASVPKRLLAIAGVAIAVVLILVFGGNTAPKKAQNNTVCLPYRQDKVVRISNQLVKAEVADSPSERDKGLSGRSCITDNEGMLFIFNKPGRYAFWMKDMKFPIDIVWIDANHKVVALEVDVEPSTYPDRFINKDSPAQYVLELKANRAQRLGIDLGTQVNF